MPNSSTVRLNSADLYRRCTSSDEGQVHEAFQQLGRLLFQTARHVLNRKYDDSVAEDCVQQALLEIWSQLKEGKCVEAPDAFLAWAILIVQRRCIDRVRYLEIRRAEELPSESETDPASDEPTPDQQMIAKEKRILLLTGLRRHHLLSPQSKTVLIDGFLFEKPDDDLAHALETTEGNIRLIRYRNLNKLRSDKGFLELLSP